MNQFLAAHNANLNKYEETNQGEEKRQERKAEGEERRNKEKRKSKPKSICRTVSSHDVTMTHAYVIMQSRLLEARLDNAISPTMSPAEISPRSSISGISGNSAVSPRELDASLDSLRIDQSRPGRGKEKQKR